MLAQPHAAAVSQAMKRIPTEGNSGIAQLKARARLYRSLADTLYDPQIIDVVLACASECETQAGALAGSDFRSESRG